MSEFSDSYFISFEDLTTHEEDLIALYTHPGSKVVLLVNPSPDGEVRSARVSYKMDLNKASRVEVSRSTEDYLPIEVEEGMFINLLGLKVTLPTQGKLL